MDCPGGMWLEDPDEVAVTLAYFIEEGVQALVGVGYAGDWG